MELSSLELRRVGEHDGAELGADDLLVGVENILAKRCHHLAPGVGVREIRFMPHLVGVDCRRTEGVEDIGHLRLAGAYATSEADYEHAVTDIEKVFTFY